MNKERRIAIARIVKDLGVEIENAKTIRGDLLEKQSEIGKLRSIESRVLDSLEEKWSETYRYESCEEALDKLTDATDNMRQLLSILQQFEDKVGEIIDDLENATFC